MPHYYYFINNDLQERNLNQSIRFFKHDFGQYEEIVAQDIRIHGPASGQETQGIEAAKRLDMGYAAAYPDAKYEIQELFASGDRVVVRWKVEATQTGERKGLRINGKSQDIPATNQKISIHGIHIYRFNEEGKIAESWAMWDRLGEIEQITQVSLSPKI